VRRADLLTKNSFQQHSQTVCRPAQQLFHCAEALDTLSAARLSRRGPATAPS
jgi:hypothetical protein